MFQGLQQSQGVQHETSQNFEVKMGHKCETLVTVEINLAEKGHSILLQFLSQICETNFLVNYIKVRETFSVAICQNLYRF